MKKLLEAFALFVHDHPEFSQAEGEQISQYLQMILDADPEKTVMRQALQYYANEYNWPYEMHSPDGMSITGMEAEEATEVAKQALNASVELKREIMIAMQDGQSSSEIFKARVSVG